MPANILKLNSRKTEIILFGTKEKLKLVDIPSLSVVGATVTVGDNSYSNLDAILYPSLPPTAQVKNITKH